MTGTKHQIAPLPDAASRLSDHHSLSLPTLCARIDALPIRPREMQDTA
ncbi:hypothetical protein [Thiohalocapsa halophila]